MSKILEQIEALPWVKSISDDRGSAAYGVSITLKEGYTFNTGLSWQAFKTVTEARAATRRSHVTFDEKAVLAAVEAREWVQIARVTTDAERLTGSVAGSYRVQLQPGWSFLSDGFPHQSDIRDFATLEDVVTGTMRSELLNEDYNEAKDPHKGNKRDTKIIEELTKFFYVLRVVRFLSDNTNARRVTVVLKDGFQFKGNGRKSDDFANAELAVQNCMPIHIKSVGNTVTPDEDGARYRFIRDTPWLGTPLGDVIAHQKNAVWDEEIDKARFAHKVQASLADTRPSVPHVQVMKEMDQLIQKVSLQRLQDHPLVKHVTYDPETDGNEVLVTLQKGYRFKNGGEQCQFVDEDEAYAELRNLINAIPETPSYAPTANVAKVKIPSFNQWWCEQEKGLRDAYIGDKWMLVNLAYRTAIGHTITAASQIIKQYTGIPADAKNPTRDRLVVLGEDLIEQLQKLRTRGDF